MNRFLKTLLFVVSCLIHLVSIGVIYYFLLPIVRWYLNSKPLWGVDFQLSVSIARLLGQHTVFPFEVWNYAGFGGWPQFLYPMLSAYFISFLSNFFDLVVSAQIVVMISSFIFVVGAYFLFYVVSRNFLLSLMLAVFVALSGGVYQVLTWAGSLPSYVSQLALPWSLGFLVLYLKSTKIRYLLCTALIGGISIFVHPLVYIVYILPSIFIVTIFTFKSEFSFVRKIKTLVIFLLISFTIGLPQLYMSIGPSLKSPVVASYGQESLSTTRVELTQTQIDVANFNKAQVKRIITDNNQAIFYLLGFCLVLFILSAIFALRVRSLIEVLPFTVLIIYFTFYVWLFGQGISIYHGGWYRLMWTYPIWAGLLASSFWFSSYESIKKAIKTIYLRYGFLILSSAIFLFAFYFLAQDRHFSTINSIVYRSEVSSAYPDVINLRVKDSQRAQLKKDLLPSFLNGDDTNWRLYDGDQTVNIWWNSIFKMPLARGYIDPPIANSNKGFSFLLDSGLSEENSEPQLSKAFNFPEDVARSMSLFLVDWNAIRYFEGAHVGNVSKPLPKYLEESLLKQSERKDFSDTRYTKRPVTLNFIEFKDDMSSPILTGTNAPTLGIFATETGYEIVTRALAERNNLNSQVLIGIKLGKNVDGYKLSELSRFDALYLHDYSYKDKEKAFETLRKFLESGKKVYIDTGTEVPETNGDLPGDLFPIKKVTRQGQGMEWQLENSDKTFTDGVDVSKFSPPDFDGRDWSISYANSEDAYSDADVILKNKGKIIMASRKVGSGEVIWGGFNLAYHIIRNHNYDETKLFQNILARMFDLKKNSLPPSTSIFVNPNERIIKTAAGGILFKEEAYDGWSARLLDGSGKSGEELKIYKAGPTYPGFMYVFLPNSQQMNQVKFAYTGSAQNKILIIISILVSILLLEEVALHGILLGRLRRFLWHHTKKRVSRWWVREDEE